MSRRMACCGCRAARSSSCDRWSAGICSIQLVAVLSGSAWLTVSRSHRPTLFRRSRALRHVIARSQVRNAASPRKLARACRVGEHEGLLRDVVRVGRRPQRRDGGTKTAFRLRSTSSPSRRCRRPEPGGQGSGRDRGRGRAASRGSVAVPQSVDSGTTPAVGENGRGQAVNRELCRNR